MGVLWLTARGHLPRQVRRQRLPGERVRVTSLRLLGGVELPSHLLRGALGDGDELALYVDGSWPGGSLQSPALPLLHADRVKVIISEEKIVITPPAWTVLTCPGTPGSSRRCRGAWGGSWTCRPPSSTETP